MRNYNFYTYILTNLNKTVLYVGMTNDIAKRLVEHYTGIGQETSFTSRYKCYYLLRSERYQYVQHAIAREKEIKGWLRKKKIALIESENPDWKFLNHDIMDWPPQIVENSFVILSVAKNLTQLNRPSRAALLTVDSSLRSE